MNMDSYEKQAEGQSGRGELVRLDSVSMDEDDEILPDFEAEVDGQRVWVTAVLERTAVIEPAPGEPKVLVNRRRLLVDPSQLRVRHLASKEAARRGREAARQLRLQEHNPAARLRGSRRDVLVNFAVAERRVRHFSFSAAAQAAA